MMQDDLAGYTAAERRYLRRYLCGWCDHSLGKPGCSACFEPCSLETRERRRRDCLANRRPRRTATGSPRTDR